MPMIREAAEIDLPAVEALLAEAGLPLDGVREARPRFWVAEAETEVVGAIGLEEYGDYGVLRSAVVEPGWREQRLGSELTRLLIDIARAERRSALYLLTEGAQEFFELFGFKRVERTEVPEEVRASPQFAGGCPATAVSMRLRLG